MDNNELYHWKIGPKKDHKYVARVKTKNPKRPWRYFYTKEEYQAYLNGDDKKDESKKKESSLLDSGKSALDRLFKKADKSIDKLKESADAGKKEAEKLLKTTKKKADKVEDKIKDAAKDVKKDVRKAASEADDKVKDIVKDSKEAAKKLTKDVKKKADKVEDKAKDVAKDVKTKVDKADDKFKDVAKDIKKTAEKKVDKIEDSAEKLADDVKKKVEDVGEKLSEGKKQVEKTLDVAKDKTVGSFEDNVKTAVEIAANFVNNTLVGGLVVATLVAIADVVVLADQISKDKRTDSSTCEEYPPTEQTILPKSKEFTKDEDMAEINPLYFTGEYAYRYNCSYCTTAYDFRQRGYDVEAAPRTTSDDPTTWDELMSWYEGAELVTLEEIRFEDNPYSYFLNDGYDSIVEATEAMEQDMLKHGEGARGHLLLSWNETDGHDVIWEVENGKVVMRDCQSNQKMEMIEYTQFCVDFAYFRTDNLEFTEEAYKTVRNKKR